VGYIGGRKGALGLSLLVAFGLMTLGTSGAQGNWYFLHEGKQVQNSEDVPLAVSSHTESLLAVADGFSTKIQCTTTKGSDLLLAAESTSGSGEVHFSGCTTTLSGKSSPNCTPVNQPIKASGTVKLVTHEGVSYLLFAPKAGKPFTTVEFGEPCALGEEVAVTGSLLAECGRLEPANTFVAMDCAEHQAKPLIRPVSSQALLGDGLKFGVNTATLSGIVGASVSGGLFGGKGWYFLHEGKQVQNSEDVPLAVSSHTESLLAVADGFSTKIQCTTTKGSDLLLAAESTSGSGEVHFSGCTTTLSGKSSPNCTPVNQPIKASGTVKLVTHEGVSYLLFAPKAGKPFTTVEFGEPCALGEEVAVTGSLLAECGRLEPANTFVAMDCAEHQAKPLIRPVSSQALLGDGLKFGVNTATLSGIVGASVSGGLFGGDAWGASMEDDAWGGRLSEGSWGGEG
jgi:hypothetical protein